MKLTYPGLLDPQVSGVSMCPGPQGLVGLFCTHPGQFFVGAALFPGLSWVREDCSSMGGFVWAV